MSTTPSPAGGRLRFNFTPAGRAIYLTIAVVVLSVIAYSVCSVNVAANEFALKQTTWGPKKGISDTVYGTGLHWVTPGVERLLVFPTDLQVLTLTNSNAERVAFDEKKAPALAIQTNGGYTVTVDISVHYRIVDPFKVYKTVGPGDLYETSLVAPRSEQILRKRLGELDAEEFYDVHKRLEKGKLALEDLNAELSPTGIQVIQVLVRGYVYDERYQAAIEQRKIQDQTVFKNKAEAELATATAEKDRLVAVGQALVRVELARGDAEKSKVEASAERYERTQRAEGQKEIGLAEAEGTRLEAQAMQAQGSEYRVGLQMAEALRNTKVIILPSDGEEGYNPLDLKSALKHFDVTP
jgi:regulator of protease activity HflC (stomatin/prohibitin superfamily)